MSEYRCPVEGCDRPVNQASMCSSCEATLERDLAEVPALRVDLEVTLSRQAVIGERVGTSGTSEPPLPYDVAASEALSVLRSTLVGWVRVVVEEDGADWPPDTLDEQSRFLLRALSWLRVHPAGNEVAEEVAAAMGMARRVVDSFPPRWYAGPCGDETGGAPCEGQLYARPSAVQVVCPACQTIYDVAARREWLVDAARGYLGTAREVSGLCRSLLGDFVSTAMIRGYAHRGTLAAHGETRDDRGRMVPLYQIGEVMTEAARAASDPRSARSAKLAALEAAHVR